MRSIRRCKEQRQLEAQRVQDTRRCYWQMYWASSVAYIRKHTEEENSISLLRELPTKTMKVSGHAQEQTQTKTMMIMVFLKHIHTQDVDNTT